ncbi:DNA-binding response regulator [Bacillus sp. M6-12]|uniref:response regulator transcription factor n=1 Tax=Bacillus sp. M6-12 TaxID=2054166 RepID=UPI000C77FDAE|nr:response regulator [Bacillus sp. M6-12]PLS14798.1 DNA-binding response regulator [Bacillus sp. M6-12]
MKVLIVDDERHVREGIKLLGEWEKFGIENILEAANGEEAILMIRDYRPEIIFSDMKMPKMDGIQLLDWIKENQPNSKTVVVTGYDDYHYMRKAIHFGSSDYILKPVDPEVLNNTLENVVKAWKREEAERKSSESSYQLLNQMKPVYRDRILTQFLNNADMKENMYEEFGFHFSRQYTAALVKINGKTISEFKGDRDLAYFTILNVINEILIENDCGIGFRYLSNKGEVVIIFWDKFDRIKELLFQIYRALQKAMDITCPTALGIPVDTRSKLIDSYQCAKQFLYSVNVLDKKEKVYINEAPLKSPLIDLMAFSSSIELAIKSGEIGAFEEVIEQIAKEFTSPLFLTMKQLIHFEKEYQVISNRWLKKYDIPANESDENIEKRLDIYFDKNGTFQLDKYIERKKREINIFLKLVKRRSSRKNVNIIYEVEKYIQANFDRDVKLQEIADKFYLSREYISRKFKQEFNVNISDYLVKVRMNKAKSLLKNSQMKVYEIAVIAGYQDDKYFRKVFKKITGVTPNEYRDSHK